MLLVTLLLRAWLVQIIAAGAQPRALADDLLIMAHGPDALPLFAQAFQASLEHLIDMGGKIASAKSTLFANNSSMRYWLQRKKWDLVGSVMPVVNSFRDLGSSLTIGVASSTKLSKLRLNKASNTLRRVFRYHTPLRTNVLLRERQPMHQGFMHVKHPILTKLR